MKYRLFFVLLLLAACKDPVKEAGMGPLLALKGKPVEAAVDKLGIPNARFFLPTQKERVYVWERSVLDEKNTALYYTPLIQEKCRTPAHYYLTLCGYDPVGRCRLQIITDEHDIITDTAFIGSKKICIFYGYLLDQ